MLVDAFGPQDTGEVTQVGTVDMVIVGWMAAGEPLRVFCLECAPDRATAAWLAADQVQPMLHLPVALETDVHCTRCDRVIVERTV